MYKTKSAPVVKGHGFNREGGGFSVVTINGVEYDAHVVADAVEAYARPQKGASHPIQASISKHEDEHHWSLKLSGTINGVSFEAEHLQPMSIPIERVPELRTLYAAIGLVDQAQRQIEEPKGRLPLLAYGENTPAMLKPTIKIAANLEADIAARDARIKVLEEQLQEFQNLRDMDWLELMDEVTRAERKVTILQEDAIRQRQEGWKPTWHLGGVND